MKQNDILEFVKQHEVATAVTVIGLSIPFLSRITPFGTILSYLWGYVVYDELSKNKEE